MKRQRGAALILFATVLVLGVAWFAVGALGKAAVATPEREIRTGAALKEAKQALLAYLAQHAARTTTSSPGQMPCPESPTLANPGEASGACSSTAINVGRLPWKTLGIDQIRDGYGEPLWYIMRGFRAAPINFGTAGQLSYNGAAVVAMIIAPGAPRNTAAVAGTPSAGCTKQDQMLATRNSPNLAAASFLECGVTTGSVTDPGNDTWTNDRIIAITADEWADAITPAIADRLQRQVAPAISNYRTTVSVSSWGQSFLPNSSTIDAGLGGSQPETNNLCGNYDERSGMPPTATVASGLCATSWSGTSWGIDLGVSLSFGGCAVTPTELRCTYTVLLGGVAPSPWIVATAPRIGYSFRRFDPAQIIVERNGAPLSGAIRNYSDSVSSADGSATIQFEIQFPTLALVDTLRVRIPHPDDALLADSRSAWWITNGWDRYTYYGVSRAATHNPGANVCTPGGVVTNCLTVNGMPAPVNDKRFALVLTGRPLAGTTQPSYDLSDYWERQNASAGVIYEVGTTDPKHPTDPFNDRVAACPFTYTNHAGATVAICN